MVLAKREGKYKGRKPIKLNNKKFDVLYSDSKKGSITQKETADRLSSSRSTLFRRIKEKIERQFLTAAPSFLYILFF